MAVPEQTPHIEHTGNGVTTSFSLKFQCESKDHLIVLVDEIEPPIATWSLSGGNVVFTTAPAAGKKITLQRNTPFSRTTDYQSYNNSFRPPAVNQDFDWIWLKLQELGVADWILGARIDALKNYVDRKDDELKAYLIEEIRKQGVALDQLDDYYNYLMQRLAQIAVDKGWDASFVVDASGKTQQELNDNLSFNYSVLNRSIKRSLYSKVQESVSLRDYGAIGDATLHTVSEWVESGVFSSLTAIQIAFPHVWSLNNSIDWAATQLCLIMQRNVYAPSGTYVFNDELNEVARTVHSGSVNRIDSGLVFYGDGTKTVFTRNNTSPATRLIDSTTGNEESISLFDDVNNAEAVFGVHCSSVKFRDFIITNSKIGFYFGQSLSESELSACYFNTLENLTIRNVGTGILLSSAYGNHYNSFNKIHFIQCQIDCEMRIGKYDLVGGADANNNRNSFINIRSNRSRVGLYCKSGDTNRLYAWDGEGCGTTATNNQFPTPQGLPVLPNETRLQTCVYIFTGKGQINRMVNCTVEGCEVNLYNNQNENEFLFSYMQEDQAGEKCWNIQEPKVFITHKTYVTPHYHQLSNLNSAAFPTFTDLGFVVRSNSIRNTTGVLVNKIKTSEGYHEHRFIDVGSVASGNTTTLTVWRDVDPEASAFIKVKISGNSTSGNISFANEVAISARRNATRTVTRYFMQEVLKMRSNGADVGDLTGITPSLQLDGRVLKLVLTAPSTTSLESIHADVEIVVST